jgi:hypothetical protein
MTDKLAKAFQIAESLPPAEQDVLAEAIMAEVAGEPAWDERFEQSQEWLAGMADRALDDARLGRTRKLDPSRM